MWMAVGLMVAGLIAIIIEFFVPAGGLVGILGLASIIGGVVYAFINYGTTIGSIFLFVALIAVPLIIVIYFKVFPRTFIGKWLILGEAQNREKGYATYTEEKYADLIGKEGVAMTVLRPAGRALIDNKKYSVVTAGDYIEAERKIKVLKVEGSRIIVAKGG